MSTAVRTLAYLVAAAFLFAPGVAQAQSEPGRLAGRVTDESGGALPGVIVTITAPGLDAPFSTLTDRTGNYAFPPLSPDSYTVQFELSGFEAATGRATIAAGEAVTLDRQLGLAPLAETVTVVASPPPPPPPPPPPVRSRPTIVIPDGTLESVCGPSQPGDGLAVGHIVRHRDNPNRRLYGRGDALVLDIGTDQNVTAGQNFVVRRRFRIDDKTAPPKEAIFAEHTAGLIQVAEAGETESIALVVYACDEFESGDGIEVFDPLPRVAEDSGGTPRFDDPDPAQIVFGDDGRSLGAPPQLMVIDHGSERGVTRGQRLTIYRRVRSAAGTITTIGEAVVVSVRPNGATIRLERAVDAVAVGDFVALHR